MIFRPFHFGDFEQVKKMYKELLNYEIDYNLYSYFYNVNGVICSSVCESNGKIVGHNAIIPRSYLLGKDEVIVGLSSGGMVDPEYSGIFLNLLKYGINKFTGHGLIAFPNMNSEPFFTKLLKFNAIAENYYSINRGDLNRNYTDSYSPEIKMSPELFNYRIDRHLKNEYFKLENNNTFVIYKKFGSEADLIYVSEFNLDLVQILEVLFDKGFVNINLVSGISEAPISMGFKNKANNIFVYKWLNKNFENITFNCQMIDSDVF
jgi:hypothetical protein